MPGCGLYRKRSFRCSSGDTRVTRIDPLAPAGDQAPPAGYVVHKTTSPCGDAPQKDSLHNVSTHCPPRTPANQRFVDANTSCDWLMRFFAAKATRMYWITGWRQLGPRVQPSGADRATLAEVKGAQKRLDASSRGAIDARTRRCTLAPCNVARLRLPTPQSGTCQHHCGLPRD